MVPVAPEPPVPPTRRPAALGRAGEDRAAAWYEAAGFEVVERNWRSRLGELDLVCRKGRLLVFCEVKTRSSDRFGAAVEAVDARKRLRLRRLGALYLASCGESHLDVRFDVVAADPAGRLVVVEDAFS